MHEAPHPAPTALLQGRFSGPTDFAQLVRDACKAAAEQGWREMVWSDPDFLAWPLREKEVVDALQAWARTGRKLSLMASQFDSVLRYHPRFVTWRIMWDHIIECRVCKHMDAQDVPSALWSPAWSMQRLDMVRSTGVAGALPQGRAQLREALAACWRGSSLGFPASTLGL